MKLSEKIIVTILAGFVAVEIYYVSNLLITKINDDKIARRLNGQTLNLILSEPIINTK